MLYKKHRPYRVLLMQIASTPFIWAILIPVLFTDLALEIYHRVCFPMYGIPTIKRGRYIVFDRFRLSYITMPEKLYCIYCSYVNGFFHYATKIGLETERYWCGIKHKNFPGYVELVEHKGYVEYGDEKAYHEKYDG